MGERYKPVIGETKLTGPSIHGGSKLGITLAYRIPGSAGIWIIAAMDDGKLKMVKIRITGANTFEYVKKYYTGRYIPIAKISKSDYSDISQFYFTDKLWWDGEPSDLYYVELVTENYCESVTMMKRVEITTSKDCELVTKGVEITTSQDFIYKVIELKPGYIGMEVDVENGKISKVHKTAQSTLFDAKVTEGNTIIKIDSKDFSEGLLRNKIRGSKNYQIKVAVSTNAIEIEEEKTKEKKENNEESESEKEPTIKKNDEKTCLN